MFDLLETCEDYKLLKDNLNTETLLSIEEILNTYQDTAPDDSNNSLDSIVINWFTGILNTEKLIESVYYL